MEFKIITVENDESFVTIDTLVKFSGNTEKAIKNLVRENRDDIEEFVAFSEGSAKFKLITHTVG